MCARSECTVNVHTRSTAFLRCFNQPIPETWELQTELEANQAAGEVDYAVEEQLEELGFEVEEKSFAEELTEMAKFDAVSTDDQCGNCVFKHHSRAFHTSKVYLSPSVFQSTSYPDGFILHAEPTRECVWQLQEDDRLRTVAGATSTSATAGRVLAASHVGVCCQTYRRCGRQ